LKAAITARAADEYAIASIGAHVTNSAAEVADAILAILFAAGQILVKAGASRGTAIASPLSLRVDGNVLVLAAF
jgi:hypothetical protein